MPLKSLKCNDQYRRSPEHLDLFDSLLVRLALAAVPLVFPGELLGSVKLSKTVIDRYFICVKLNI